MILSRRTIIDGLLVILVIALSAVAIYTLVASRPSRTVLIISEIGLVAVAVALVAARIAARPDHERALHSHMILEVATASLAHLRTGLNEESAQAVCRITLAESEAMAVAITDTERVLGFAGAGEDHHEVGGPIMTRATHDVLESNEYRILASRDEIGCPRESCPLQAAIVVPLEVCGVAVGTLKFYYTSPWRLNETQIATASGLAQLLSTQLELAELDARTELATRMELKALQAQINPHFLFNTINTIASLIRTEPPRARELLREFAAFYRRTLESQEDLIPLDREIEYVGNYFRLEKARFGDRIELEEHIPVEILGEMVPAFIVQPIVENAIQHGMRAAAPLHIRLEADDATDRIVIQVRDDGVGMSERTLAHVMEPGFGTGLGIALKNVDDRLKGYFGPGSGLRVESQEGVGTRVSLVLMRSTTAA